MHTGSPGPSKPPTFVLASNSFDVRGAQDLLKRLEGYEGPTESKRARTCRLEVDIRCFPQSLSILILRQGLSVNLEFFRDLDVSDLPELGFQTYFAESNFYMLLYESF